MEVMPIIVMLAAVCNLLLGFLIYRNDSKDKVDRWYGIFGVVTGVWVLGNYLLNFFPTAFWIKTVYAIGALVPISALMWIFYFCERKNTRLQRTILWLIGGVFFVIPFIDNLFLYNIKRVYLGGVDADLGPAFYLYVCYMFGSLLLIIGELSFRYRRSSGVEKLQTKFVLLGAVIWISFVLLVDFVLPLFRIQQYIPLDAPSSLIFLIFTAYAITKHQLFNVKVIATELLTFILCIILLVKTLSSETPQDWTLNIIVLLLAVFFGILLIRSVLRDVKQREEMEKMAKDLEKAYQTEKWSREVIEEQKVRDEAFLGSIGDGIIATDKDGKILFINRAAEEIFKMNSKDLIGLEYSKALIMENEKGEVIPKEMRPLSLALNSGKKIVTSAAEGSAKMVYYVKKDKTKFPAAITVAPVILEGKIIGAVDVFRDVTVERQLDRSKSEFVSLASHQLRTPLTAIKWYSEMLMGRFSKNLDVKQRKCVREIHNGNERMINLIDVMLNISRFEAGKIKINPVLTNVKNFLDSIIKEQKFDIKKRKQKFIFECPDSLPEIMIDQNMMRLVFQNLVSNAIKYTPNEGSIQVVVENKGDIFSFKVADTGIGIPKEQKKRIFEKLFRADNAFTHEPEGNGLGLYAAKMTVEQLGGKIWFDSKVNTGTTFFVELPAKRG